MVATLGRPVPLPFDLTDVLLLTISGATTVDAMDIERPEPSVTWVEAMLVVRVAVPAALGVSI